MTTTTAHHRCNYCHEPIIWARTHTDALMPLDADPSADGNVLIHKGRAGVLARQQAAGARATGHHLHTHHAVHCPYAAKWRKRGSR